jgi:hypothetical protein
VTIPIRLILYIIYISPIVSLPQLVKKHCRTDEIAWFFFKVNKRMVLSYNEFDLSCDEKQQFLAIRISAEN